MAVSVYDMRKVRESLNTTNPTLAYKLADRNQGHSKVVKALEQVVIKSGDPERAFEFALKALRHFLLG